MDVYTVVFLSFFGFWYVSKDTGMVYIATQQCAQISTLSDDRCTEVVYVLGFSTNPLQSIKSTDLEPQRIIALKHFLSPACIRCIKFIASVSARSTWSDESLQSLSSSYILDSLNRLLSRCMWHGRTRLDQLVDETYVSDFRSQMEKWPLLLFSNLEILNYFGCNRLWNSLSR